MIPTVDEPAPESEVPTVFSLARLDPQKRPWLMFDLARAMPDVRFVMAGKTHAELRWQPTSVPENLVLAGEVKGEEKARLIVVSPDDGQLVVDVDSTIVEVHGKKKQGASYGYTRQLSLHPLVATRADTGEVLHLRTRRGAANTARGAVRFVAETHGRVRRASATGSILWRFDSGFWNNDLMKRIEDRGDRFTVGIRMQKPIVAATPSTRARGSTSSTTSAPRPRSPKRSTTTGGWWSAAR